MTDPNDPRRPRRQLGYNPILGRLLSRLAPIVTRQDEVDEVGPARPLGSWLRPEPVPGAPDPIYTGGVPSDAPSPYRMADLSVGPEGVDVGKASGYFEENLRRAPYTSDATPKISQVDYEQLQADLGELERRRDDPTLAPDTRATYDAAVTNLRQQVELGRRFGMGGTGASPAAQFGWNALDAATLGLTGAAYQRELARRAEEGTLVEQRDLTTLLGHPAQTETVPRPGGAGVAGGLAGGIGAFMVGEGALKAGTMALRGTRFGALARPAEAYFEAAYRPITPYVESWAGGPVMPRSALDFALRRTAQGSIQGAPVGAVMDAARARLEGRDVLEGVEQGGLYGAAIGGVMEATGLPSSLWGRGAPWEYARYVSADDALARATVANPFHQPVQSPDAPVTKPLWPENGGMPPTGPEPPAMGTQGVLKPQPPEPGLQTSPTRAGRPDISTTQETLIPSARRPKGQNVEPMPDEMLSTLTPEERAEVNHPEMLAMLEQARGWDNTITQTTERRTWQAQTGDEMSQPTHRGAGSPDEYLREFGVFPDATATRPPDAPKTFTLVVGLPGVGKTSRIIRGMVRAQPWKYIVDADQAAKRAPEWKQLGRAARSALHPDAVAIAEDFLLPTLLDRGEDIIFSKIGSDPAALTAIIERAKALGYRVELAGAALDPGQAALRAARRARDPENNGHVVNLRYIVEEVGDKPIRSFEQVRHLADASRLYDMGVAPTEEPRILHSEGRWYDDANGPEREGVLGRPAGQPEDGARGDGPRARQEAGRGDVAPRPARARRQVGPDLQSEAGFFGEQFLPAEMRAKLDALRAAGQRLPETLDELQTMVAGLRDAEGRPQFDALRERIDQLPPELRAAPTELLDRAAALHERVSGATEGLADRVRPAALIGGLAAGGLAGAAVGGLLPDDTTATGKGIAAVAAFTAGLLAGAAGGGMVARSFGRGGARRMEFPELPARPTPVEVPVETRPDPGPAPRMEPEPEVREEPPAPTGPKPGDVIQGGFPSGKEAGALMKELAAQGQRAEVRRQKDGTFAVVAKGAKQESTAVAKVEQTELLPATLENGLPYTPGASPEQNRPARTDAGWALPVDEQGRFYSRLGRALERLPAQRHTAAEWLKQMESGKGFSKLEYETVLKPVLEKIAAADDAPAVFPWLREQMGNGSAAPYFPELTDAENAARTAAWDADDAARLAAWPTRKLTPEDLLALAKRNRFQLKTVRLGSDKQSDPTAMVTPAVPDDPLGFAREVAAYEAGRDVTQNEAWTEHVEDLEQEKDRAEEHYNDEQSALENLFGDNGVPSWNRLDTSDLEDAIRENYKIKEAAEKVWQEAYEDLDVSSEAWDEVLGKAQGLAWHKNQTTGKEMNGKLDRSVFDNDLYSVKVEDGYVLFDADGEEVARDPDHWALWRDYGDLEREFEREIDEAADRLRDEAMPSVDDIVAYAQDAAGAYEEYSVRESDYEDATNNWGEDEIREWLENEGHDLPDPDALPPDPAQYGLAPGMLAGSGGVDVEAGDYNAKGVVLFAVGEPATRTHPEGAPVYYAGKYLTPEESRDFVVSRRNARNMRTALEWNTQVLSPWSQSQMPRWDGSLWRDYTGAQKLYLDWQREITQNYEGAIWRRDATEQRAFFPWARRGFTTAEREAIDAAYNTGGSPAAVSAMRQIGGLPTLEEVRLLRPAFEDKPLELDGSVLNLVVGRDLLPPDLEVGTTIVRDVDGSDNEVYFIAAPSVSYKGLNYDDPAEAWRYTLFGDNSPSHSAAIYNDWQRNQNEAMALDQQRSAYLPDPSRPAGSPDDPVRLWYENNLHMPEGDYDPRAHGLIEGINGRILRAAADPPGVRHLPPHAPHELVYDELGYYWGPGEFKYMAPGVLNTALHAWRPSTPPLPIPAAALPPDGSIPTRAIPGPARDPATLFAPPEPSAGKAAYSGYVMPPGPGMSKALDYREVLTVIHPSVNPLEPEGAVPVFGDSEHFRSYPVVHHMTRMQDYETHETGEKDFLLMVQEGQGDVANTAADRAANVDLLDKSGATKYGTRRRTYTAEKVPTRNIPDLVNKAKQEERAADATFTTVSREVQHHFDDWRNRNTLGLADVDDARAYIATPEGGAHNARLEAAFAAKNRAIDARAHAERLEALANKKAQTQGAFVGDVEIEGVENATGASGTFIRDNATVGEFMVKRLLLEWAERGRGTLLGWSNAAMVKNRWGRKAIFDTVYDTAPSRYARLYLDRLLGKEMSARIDIYNRVGGEDHAGNGWRIRIPKDIADEVRRRIQQNGIELMSLVPLPLVLMAETLDEAQQDEATRDLLRLVKGAGIAAAGGLALYGAAKGVRKLRRFRTRPELPHTGVEADAHAPVEPETLTPEALPTGKRASEGRVGRGKVPRLTEKEVSRLGLPSHLEKEVVQAVDEQRGLVGGPEVVSNEEMLRRAQAELDVGEEALIDLDPSRATAAQIIAIASLAGQKKRTADLFWQRALDPSLAASEQRANAKMAERMDEDFLALMTGSMRGSSEAGRTLNAMKLLANLRPDPDYWWRRTMKMLDRPLTPEERLKIDAFLKNDQRAELVQYLARLKKTGIPSQIVTLLNAGLFTRPAARALDLISSGGNLLLEHGVNAPGRVLLDRLVAMATGARTATLPGSLQIQGIGRGMYHGLQTAAKSMGWHAVAEAPRGQKWSAWVDYMRNVEMTPEMLARYDLPHLTNIDLFSLSRNPEAPANVVMDAIQKTIYRTLGFSDRILVGAAYEGAVADLAMARALSEKHPHPKQRAEELIANPPDDLRFDAMLMASRITFNNEEAMARLSKLVMRAPGDALRKVEGPVGELSGDLADAGMRWQFPVVRTVANITARALDYIPPIGTARGFYNLWSAFRAGLEPGLRRRKQRVAVEVLSRNLTGSALVAVGAYLYQQGLMTGAASTDPSERNLATGIGQTPNSLLWNGEWVPIGRLPPFGTLLAVGATLAQIAERRDKAGGKLGLGAGATFAVGRAILDQPFLTGSRSALDALQDPVTRSENYLEQQVGRIVPTAVAEMAAADGLARDVNGPVDALKARLPGLRDDLPVQVTGYGDPMQGRTGLANRLFNPFAGSPDKRIGDPVLSRSYDLGYIPGRVARDRATPTTPQESPEEYARRAAFVGGLRKTMVGNAMATHPVFTDPAYLDKLARQVVATDPDFAGLTLNEAKRKLQQAFVKETSEGVSAHEDPAQVPRRFGGQR